MKYLMDLRIYRHPCMHMIWVFILAISVSITHTSDSEQTCDNMAESSCSSTSNNVYRFDVQKVKRSLADRGVAVIPDVISTEDCDTYIGEYQEWLKEFGSDFPGNRNSIFHGYKVAHARPNWDVRLKTKSVFSQLWGTDKLLSSMDGMAIGEPPESGRTKFYVEDEHTLHVDQSPKRVGLHAYQGALYLEQAELDDWSFMVMENAHKFHEEFFHNFNFSAPTEYRRLSDKEVKWYEDDKGCSITRVACPKGGLILWDSRLVHAGAPPLSDRANPGRWRYVVFVSMTPAAWASPSDLDAKHDAYKKLKAMRHWSSQGSSSFKVNLELGHNIVNELPDVALTEEAQRLAGVLPYDFEDGQPNGPPSPVWQD